jgi:arginyl-tRNA synthetase
LSHDPVTDIDFSWDKALALDGNSGPYLQYAYARVNSLMEKAGVAGIEGAFSVEESSERALALQLLEFPGAVVRAAESYKPSILSDYLFQTAQLYSSFYQNTPVLKSEEATRRARLNLCALFGSVLSKGLSCLGIETPKRI